MEQQKNICITQTSRRNGRMAWRVGWWLVGFWWILSGYGGVQARAKGSFRDYQKACEKGNPNGCLHLGFLLELGKKVPKDPQEALRMYLRACELNQARGCTDAGVMWAKGLVGKPSMMKALTLYEKGCAGRDHKGCFLWASWLEREQPTQPIAAAHQAYEKACTYGSGAACVLLGRRFASGRLAPRDPKRAAELFRRACLWRNDHEGCARWSIFLERGVGGTADPALAQRNWKWSCEKKYGFACTLLGASFRDGRVGKPSPTKAAKMFRLGCRLRDPNGCMLLARLYESGSGTKASKAKPSRQAQPLYQKACQLGMHQACFELAVSYEKGLALRKNRDLSLKMYEKSCDLGSGIGCYALAFHLQAGPPQVIGKKKKKPKKKKKKSRTKEDLRSALAVSSSRPAYQVPEAKVLRLVQRACALGYVLACKAEKTREP